MRAHSTPIYPIYVILILFAFTSPVSAEQEPGIRVALEIGATRPSVCSSGGMSLRELESGVLVDVVEQGAALEFIRKGDHVKSSGGHQAASFALYPTDGFLEYGGKPYRGGIQIVPGGDGLTVINALPMEQYLCGVVPCEVPYSWEMEALKAQAVAARTYAVNRSCQSRAEPYDVVATAHDQVYGGVSAERERTDDAIRATRGIVMTYGGEPIIAYYCASAGGCTVGHDLPYLRPVYSPDAECHAWSVEVGASELADMLEDLGKQVGKLHTIQIHECSPSGRVLMVSIKGSKDTALVSANDLRRLVGYGRMKSTRFGIGEDAVFPPVTAEGVAGAGGMMLREMLTRALVKLGSGRVPVVSADGMDEIRLGLSVVLGAAGRHYLGSDNYAVGYELSIAEFPSASDEGESNSGMTCHEPVTIGDDVIFTGRGYGHGIGMSQHGAKFLAESGWDYARILSHYYSGVDLVSYYE